MHTNELDTTDQCGTTKPFSTTTFFVKIDMDYFLDIFFLLMSYLVELGEKYNFLILLEG